MTDSSTRDSSTRFTHSDAHADAVCAAQLRQEFSAWLTRYFAVDATKASDVILAVNEALANAAEFAYAKAGRPGAMHLRADYDCDESVLTVTVTDDGAWRITDREKKRRSRGRGIPLMHALADKTTIDSTSTGTRVSLVWNHIAAALPAAT